MKKHFGCLLSIITALFLICLSFFAIDKFLDKFSDRFLGYEIIDSIQSPDNSKTAYIQSVNPGATSDYSYRVSISSNKNFEELDKEKYCFNFDSNHGGGSTKIKLIWLDNSNLQIEYFKGIRIFTQKEKMSDVNILYKESGDNNIF